MDLKNYFNWEWKTVYIQANTFVVPEFFRISNIGTKKESNQRMTIHLLLPRNKFVDLKLGLNKILSDYWSLILTRSQVYDSFLLLITNLLGEWKLVQSRSTFRLLNNNGCRLLTGQKRKLFSRSLIFLEQYFLFN